MELFATVVYVISDEVRRILCLKEDHQSQMSDSEVILPRYIKARTEKGFLIKIICFILAYGASFLAKNPLM